MVSVLLDQVLFYPLLLLGIVSCTEFFKPKPNVKSQIEKFPEIIIRAWCFWIPVQARFHDLHISQDKLNLI